MKCQKHLYGTCPECASDYDDDWDYDDELDRPYVPKSKQLGYCDFCLAEGTNPCRRCGENERYEREWYE